MPQPERFDVESQLQRILSSPRFAASERLSLFLRFVVDAALRGDPGGAKEVVIAGEVYGRGAGYDPQVDSTVRADASRLRARLSEFYATAGVDDRVLIEIPRGTYLPVFSLRPQPTAVETVPVRRPRPARYVRWMAAALGALFVGCLATLWAVTFRASHDAETAAAELEQRARHLVPTVGDHLLRASQPQPEYPLDKLLLAAGAFEAAVKLEPSRVTAWTGMAQTFLLAGQHDQRYMIRAHEAANQALRLGPNRADTQFLHAYVRFFEDWDFEEARNGFLKAIQIDPHLEAAYRHYSDAALLTGHAADADRVLESGLNLFPRSHLILLSRAMLRYYQGRYDEMLTVARELPPDLDLTHWVRGLAWEQQGEWVEAERELSRCLTISPHNARCSIALLHLEAKMGRTSEAENRVAGLADGEGELMIARVFQHTGLRNKAQAMEWIRRGIAQHDYSIPWLLIDPRFDPLRKEPEFVAEMRRVSGKP